MYYSVQLFVAKLCIVLIIFHFFAKIYVRAIQSWFRAAKIMDDNYSLALQIHSYIHLLKNFSSTCINNDYKRRRNNLIADILCWLKWRIFRGLATVACFLPLLPTRRHNKQSKLSTQAHRNTSHVTASKTLPLASPLGTVSTDLLFLIRGSS